MDMAIIHIVEWVALAAVLIRSLWMVRALRRSGETGRAYKLAMLRLSLYVVGSCGFIIALLTAGWHRAYPFIILALSVVALAISGEMQRRAKRG
jgi:hypothetical protein